MITILLYTIIQVNTKPTLYCIISYSKQTKKLLRMTGHRELKRKYDVGPNVDMNKVMMAMATTELPPGRKYRNLSHLTNEEKDFRRKWMNRMNSQVSRDRRRDQMEKLEERVKVLEMENEKMSAENEQLRMLLAQKQSIELQLLLDVVNQELNVYNYYKCSIDTNSSGNYINNDKKTNCHMEYMEKENKVFTNSPAKPFMMYENKTDLLWNCDVEELIPDYLLGNESFHNVTFPQSSPSPSTQSSLPSPNISSTLSLSPYLTFGDIMGVGMGVISPTSTFTGGKEE